MSLIHNQPVENVRRSNLYTNSSTRPKVMLSQRVISIHPQLASHKRNIDVPTLSYHLERQNLQMFKDICTEVASVVNDIDMDF